jgi:hypothetical protein
MIWNYPNILNYALLLKIQLMMFFTTCKESSLKSPWGYANNYSNEDYKIWVQKAPKNKMLFRWLKKSSKIKRNVLEYDYFPIPFLHSQIVNWRMFSLLE